MDPIKGGGCDLCRERGPSKVGFEFDMAFQPIVDTASGEIFAHEALVRGPAGEGAFTVLEQVTETNRYGFDQLCRTKAIERASGFGIGENISINFMPNAVYEPRNCIQRTLWAADKYNFPLERIIFEFTEDEQIADTDHLKRIMQEYRHQGFRTAIDDFGAGFSGLRLLAEIQPDLIKIDMDLIRGIDQDRPRRVIVRSIIEMAEELDIDVICEGIETEGERDTLQDLGVTLMQGYLFARPVFRGALQASGLENLQIAA